MALPRCDDHRPEPSGEDYLGYAHPVGYPSDAPRCEVLGCINPARLWLTEAERDRFRGGLRAFETPRLGSVRSADDLFPN
jgi:hypothetical protein